MLNRPFAKMDVTHLNVYKIKHILIIDIMPLFLTGLDVRGGLEFLCQITSSCRKLYFLSLAQLRGLEMAGALPTLNKALSKCSNLKHFRFSIPHLNRTCPMDVKAIGITFE